MNGAPIKTLPPVGQGKTLDGICGDCSTVWVMAVLPMTVEKTAALAKAARCPACASKKVHLYVPQAPTNIEFSPKEGGDA
jgi:hypothetical protein